MKRTIKLIFALCTIFTFVFFGNRTTKAEEGTLRYAVGAVRDFRDVSNTSRMDVTSIVPTPGGGIEHEFSALHVVGQNCNPGEECYDVMDRKNSGYHSLGFRFFLSEIDSHTYGNRKPRVEGYRNN